MALELTSPWRSRPVSPVLGLAVGVFLVLNFLYARLQFGHSTAVMRTHAPVDAQMKLPASPVMRGLALNHDTLAADVVWMWSLVYLGEQRAARRYPKYLDDYAHTIADLDPYFFPVYRWFSATYLNSVSPVGHEDLERVNAFIRRGFEYFPNDYRLPYTAGMNYIGHSAGRPPAERLEEVESAIELLQRAAQRPGAPESLPLTVSWLYQRKRQLEVQISDTSSTSDQQMRDRQIDFFTSMYYQVESEDNRRRIRQVLEDLGADESLLDQERIYRRKLQRRHTASFGYLPVDLWATLHSESH